jgi:hypothetical protein
MFHRAATQQLSALNHNPLDVIDTHRVLRIAVAAMLAVLITAWSGVGTLLAPLT